MEGLSLEIVGLVATALATIGAIASRLISVIEEQAKALNTRLENLNNSVTKVGNNLAELEVRTIQHFEQIDKKLSGHDAMLDAFQKKGRL